MAYLTAAPTAITLDSTVTINSFGHDYTGTVVELKDRTCKVRYTNKGGREYTLQVKRTDVAEASAAQKAGTERAIQTKRLRNDVRGAKRQLEYSTTIAAETLDDVNAKRAESRRIAEGYGWTIRENDLPMSPEAFAVLHATRQQWLREAEERLAKAEQALAEHEAR